MNNLLYSDWLLILAIPTAVVLFVGGMCCIHIGRRCQINEFINKLNKPTKGVDNIPK